MAALGVNPDKPLSKAVIFGSSGLGGVLGWIVVHPFNTLAVRMNLSAMGGGGAPKPFLTFASDLIKKEGVGGLYAGLGAGCLRQVFYATSRYGLFETFRDSLGAPRPYAPNIRVPHFNGSRQEGIFHVY